MVDKFIVDKLKLEESNGYVIAIRGKLTGVGVNASEAIQALLKKEKKG